MVVPLCVKVAFVQMVKLFSLKARWNLQKSAGPRPKTASVALCMCVDTTPPPPPPPPLSPSAFPAFSAGRQPPGYAGNNHRTNVINKGNVTNNVFCMSLLGLTTIIFPHLHSQLIRSNRQTEKRSHMLRENEETAE